MAQSTFTKKLAKDLSRNPKKTAVLALLCAVAIWFWVPLVWKWIKPNSDVPAAAGVVTPAPTAGSVVSQGAPSTTVSAAKPPALDWRNLTELFQNHQLTAAAELSAELRDPFARNEPEVNTESIADEEDEAITTPATAILQTPTPKELGLVLRSTATGGGVRLARINGQLCGVGTVLMVPSGDVKLEYEIVEIGLDRVMLLSSGQLFELQRQADKTTMQIGAVGQRVVLDALRRD
jgi:hypothetical protein